MGKALTDLSEVLFRQIHPNSYHAGCPASDRFKPQPSDNGLMSVDRGSMTSAVASHALYTATGRQSVAVFGISVEEFTSESLNCNEDPIAAQDELPANPAHALVDFSGLDGSKCRLISKRLCLKATSRGRLYPLE